MSCANGGTHHYACDCREAAHCVEVSQLREEVARLRARILAIDTGMVIAASQLEALQDELRGEPS